MTEHIEARILALAEAAIPDGDWWPVASWKDGPGSPHRALFAACSPATVSRLARVVGAARTVDNEWRTVGKGQFLDRRILEALAALDADAPEGGK